MLSTTLTTASIVIARSSHSQLMGLTSVPCSLTAHSGQSICTGRCSTVRFLFHARSKIAFFAAPHLQVANSLIVHLLVVGLSKTTLGAPALPRARIGMAALLQNAKAGNLYATNDVRSGMVVCDTQMDIFCWWVCACLDLHCLSESSGIQGLT